MCLLKSDHKVFLKEYITFKLIQRNKTELEKKFKKSNQKRQEKTTTKKAEHTRSSKWLPE